MKTATKDCPVRTTATHVLALLLAGIATTALEGQQPARLAVEEDPATTLRRLSVADTFAIQEVSDPRVSPDGGWIAYVATTTDLDEDSSRSRIWMVAADGGEAVPMTAISSSAQRPRWSPDGRHLAFLSARDDGKTQVWTLFREGGDAVQRTDVAQGVSAFEWSPDSQRLALILRDPKPEQLDDETDRGEGPWVITRRQFKSDYVGYLDDRRSHLYVFDLATEKTTQRTGGPYDDSDPAWSPDGTRIAFVSNRSDDPDANYDSNIWVVEASPPGPVGSATAPVDRTRAGSDGDDLPSPQQISTSIGSEDSPAWSPDSALLTFRSVQDHQAVLYATPHLAVAPSRGGDTVVLTDQLDRHIYSPRFSPDGASLYFLLEDRGELQLARLPAGGGAIERLVHGEQVVDAFDFGPDGTIAMLITEPWSPAEIFVYRDGALEQLTNTNAELLAELELGAVERVRFPSRDGTVIEGFVVRPPDFEEGVRYPTILRLHGGPVSQYDFRFHFEAQLFAAHGYLVLLPNPRGSSGYGQEFSFGIWKQWGGPDFEDVVAAVDFAIERGWSDPDRLGVGGWSYGGMLTNHVITKSDRFHAAITGASATLYVANYGHDQYQRWWEYELGLPWEPESRRLWEELSPFNRVENVVTPTLIVGGEKDWNVPILNSEQLFMALKRLGRTAELVVYPGEYHGIDTPSHLRDLYQRYLAWYGRYLLGEGPKP